MKARIVVTSWGEEGSCDRGDIWGGWSFCNSFLFLVLHGGYMSVHFIPQTLYTTFMHSRMYDIAHNKGKISFLKVLFPSHKQSYFILTGDSYTAICNLSVQLEVLHLDSRGLAFAMFMAPTAPCLLLYFFLLFLSTNKHFLVIINVSELPS